MSFMEFSFVSRRAALTAGAAATIRCLGFIVSVSQGQSATGFLRRNVVRAQLRVIVKRIPRKYGYPPDKQKKATETVLEQAALLSAERATA